MTNPQVTHVDKDEVRTHTPTPWRTGDFEQKITEQWHQVMHGDMVIATCNQNFIGQAIIDADFIVEAVNNYASLCEKADRLAEALMSYDGPAVDKALTAYNAARGK